MEIVELEHFRFDPQQIAEPDAERRRLPLSTFLQLRPQPLGAVFGWARGENYPAVLNGAELARYFEDETPGLAHRHALNHLVRQVRWSPPRQALVWAALDVTIYTALSAAWYYKWISPKRSFRERPWEYAVRNKCRLNVLYDRPVNGLGTDSVPDLVSYPPNPNVVERDGRRPPYHPVVPNFLNGSPGTPRHPAYPSGHSTYSAAASEILSYFFPDYRQEFDRLADNIGIARLWAGVHWRSDHTAGAALGRKVACLIIDQLRRSGIPLVAPRGDCDDRPPTADALAAQGKAFKENCGNANTKDPFPVPSPTPCPPNCPTRTTGKGG